MLHGCLKIHTKFSSDYICCKYEWTFYFYFFLNSEWLQHESKIKSGWYPIIFTRSNMTATKFKWSKWKKISEKKFSFFKIQSQKIVFDWTDGQIKDVWWSSDHYNSKPKKSPSLKPDKVFALFPTSRNFYVLVHNIHR